MGGADSFKAIAAVKAPFVARADKSGTSTKELGIWEIAGLDPAATKPAWYIETGQGMGASLIIASEKGAYILTDRATYLANKDTLDLDILAEGEKALLNIYHVITVNPDRCPKINTDGTVAFKDFMIDSETQEVIGQFGTEKFGQPLFTPDAGKDEATLP
jgi:tungstate transport system substrate-binding protein